MVTGASVLILSAIGFFRVLYEPLLPSSPTEYLVTVPKHDTVPAPIVEIDWKRTMAEGQSEAKRRKLGMLIFLVDPSNYYAKELELDTFRDPEVARFVNRTFVAVKIDLDEHPEWAQVLLPLRRLNRYVDSGVDLVVTNEDGELINHFDVESPFQYAGPETVLPFFIDSLKKLGEGDKDPTLQTQQENDLRFIVTAAADPLPSFSKFTDVLLKEFKFKSPGLFASVTTRFRPNAVRYLAKSGHSDVAVQICRSLGCSPLYDPIDGGFFREIRTQFDQSLIDTSKTVGQNSLSAVVLAQLGCLSHDPQLMSLAKDTGTDVLTEFSQDDSVYATRLNDQDLLFRSARSSLTDARMKGLLTPDMDVALRRYLTFDLSKDQRLVALKDLASLDDPGFLKLRAQLREKLNHPAALSQADQASTTGYVAARLFDLYRYTGDIRFLNRAKTYASQAYQCLAKDLAFRTFGSPEQGRGWLGTYLSIADCGLADYAATGEIYPLRDGERALRMGIKMFRDADTGLLNNTPPDPSTGFEFSSAVPDLADKGRESWNSLAIRLAFAYGNISEVEANRSEYQRLVQSMLVRLNSAMADASVVAGGYYDAAFDAVRNRTIIVSGPNRVADATALARTMPLEMIFPANLAGSGDKVGYYIREGGKLSGPFDRKGLNKELDRSAPVQGM